MPRPHGLTPTRVMMSSQWVRHNVSLTCCNMTTCSFPVLHCTQHLHRGEGSRQRKCRGNQLCLDAAVISHSALDLTAIGTVHTSERVAYKTRVHSAMQGRILMLKPRKICGSGFSSTPWPATWSQMAADLRWQPCLLKELTPSSPSCSTFAPQSMHTTGVIALTAAFIWWSCNCSVFSIYALQAW